MRRPSAAAIAAVVSLLACSDTAHRAADSGATSIDLGARADARPANPAPVRDVGPPSGSRDARPPPPADADPPSRTDARVLPPPCDRGLVRCGDACTDVASDPRHCGACEQACGAGCVCAAGACVTVCPAGLTRCDGGSCGVCVDLRTDPDHCGACGNVLAEWVLCSDGMPVAAPGFMLCDGIPFPLNDPNNCGACGVVCSGTCPSCQFDIVTGTASCYPGCPSGYSPCSTGRDAGPPPECNLYCTNTNADNSHCGGCGIVCTGGSNCSAGACTCGALTDCDDSDVGFDCRDPATDPCPGP